MEEQRFDDLARLVATKTSRRQMLKVLVAGTVGAWFARAGGGLAFAGTCKPNPACVKYCNDTFGGANTPAARQCNQDSTHCTGACYTCGPASPGGTNGGTPCTYSPCPADNFAGGTLCCAAGQTCVPNFFGSGSVCTATTANDCPSGTVYYNGICAFSECGGH